ncbi:uncharacterized protein AAES06_015532 [Glossophaga mutica]
MFVRLRCGHLWLSDWCFGERPKSTFSSHPQKEHPAARGLLTARRAVTVAQRSPASRSSGKEVSWPGGQVAPGSRSELLQSFSPPEAAAAAIKKNSRRRGDREGTSAQLRSHGLLNLGEPRPPGAPSLFQRRRGQSSESGRRRPAGHCSDLAECRLRESHCRRLASSRAPRSRCAEERSVSDRDFSKPAARASGRECRRRLNPAFPGANWNQMPWRSWVLYQEHTPRSTSRTLRNRISHLKIL